MSSIRAEALKEKKAMEEAYEEGFNVIFNYGYGCCAFAHNIGGSKPEVPDGVADTSKSLSLEFFINPQCLPGAILAEAVSNDVIPGEVMNGPEKKALPAIPKMSNSEAGEHLSVVEVGSSNKVDFFT